MTDEEFNNKYKEYLEDINSGWDDDNFDDEDEMKRLCLLYSLQKKKQRDFEQYGKFNPNYFDKRYDEK